MNELKARKELEKGEEKVSTPKEWNRRTEGTKTDDVSGEAEQRLVFKW